MLKPQQWALVRQLEHQPLQQELQYRQAARQQLGRRLLLQHLRWQVPLFSCRCHENPLRTNPTPSIETQRLSIAF